MAINVDKLSLKELRDLEAKLTKAKSQAREKAKAEVKKKIDRILASSGFTIGDIYSVGRGRGRGRGRSAKYVNPDNRSQTWTGRGRKPNWLVAKLKRGAKQEDFAV